MASHIPKPKIEVVFHEGYRTIMVSGVFGGHRPGYFEAIIYTDEMIVDEALRTVPPDPAKVKVKRTLQCRLILDPIQAKSLVKWLTHHINQYEKMFGEIKMPGRMEKKEEKSPSSMVI